MATVNNGEVIRSLVDKAGVDVGLDDVPNQLGSQIVPVLKVNPSSRIVYIEDDSLNSNSKTISVPAGKIWQIQVIFVEWVADANAGNRRIKIEILTEGNALLFLSQALNQQPASGTEWYNWLPGINNVSESFPTTHFLPLFTPCILKGGTKIRISDGGNTSTGDDFQYHIQALETNEGELYGR